MRQVTIELRRVLVAARFQRTPVSGPGTLPVLGEAPPSARFCSVPPYERMGSVSFGPGLFSWPINAFQMYQLVLEMYEVVFEMHIREPRRKRNLSWRGDPPTNARLQCSFV